MKNKNSGAPDYSKKECWLSFPKITKDKMNSEERRTYDCL